MDRLAVAVAQPQCVPSDVSANAAAHAELVDVARSRLVVFPEMSLTGYELDHDPIDPGDQRLQPIVEACERRGSIALVGAPTMTGGRRHLSIIAIDARGAMVAYDKMWLGGDEPHHFTPGEHPRTIDVDGWSIGLAVCKDTGVAEHAEATMPLGCDVYAAGVLEHLHDADVQPRRVASIIERYGVWVAVASFAGPTGHGYDRTAGGSAIWSRNGEVVAATSTEPGVFASFVLTHDD